MVALGLDIGTTKISLICMDTQTGKVTSLASLQTPCIPSDLPFEHKQDAEKIITLVDKMLSDFDLSQVVSIGVTGQMHGIVYLNSNGNIVSPLYTWQDQRGAQKNKSGMTYTSELNIPVGYGHATHYYNVENGLVPQEAVGYCTIADAVVTHLSGVSAPLLHISNAASFGQFDMENNCFSADIPFPYSYQIVDNYAIVGEYHGIPVAIAIGDNQASFLGSGCGEGDVLINIGTGSQVSMLSDIMINNGSIETRPAMENKKLLVGSALCGGRAYAMLHDFFCQVVEIATGERPENMYDHMNSLLNDAKDASLRFDNSFCGTRSAPWRRGSIQGIGEQNFTPRDFCIGILEGIVNELAEMYNAMGCYTDHIIGSGNALRKNPLLCQLCEKRFGAHMTLTSYVEEAACGAALFSLISCGKLANMKEANAFLLGKNR